MKRVSMLPNLLTLGNAGCGLLAISKAIDALAARADSARFDHLIEMSCWLILFAGVQAWRSFGPPWDALGF